MHPLPQLTESLLENVDDLGEKQIDTVQARGFGTTLDGGRKLLLHWPLALTHDGRAT